MLAEDVFAMYSASFDLDCKKVEGRFSRIHMYNFTFSNDLMSDCLSTIIFPFQNGGDTVDEVFETTFYFMIHDDVLVQKDALHALGAVCIRHYDYMLKSKLKSLYIDILNEDFYCVQHKIKASTFLIPPFISFVHNIHNIRVHTGRSGSI